MSEELGNSMKVAYLPDSFGSNSNLPQIISKTNNIGIINWRGWNEELINNSLFNLWEAEDGTKFPVYNLYKHGYFTGVDGLLKLYHSTWSKKENTIWDAKTNAKQYAKNYIEWLKNELEILKPLSESTGRRILIPIGSDQMPMIRGWKFIVEEMNNQDLENEYLLSDFEKFMQDVVNDNQVIENANIIKGQFRYGKTARAHKTITSSRYDIKQLSRLVENLLYGELEPISVMYKKMGGEYPSTVILEATKRLLSCHAHDSLGGCNTDETNRSIVSRLEAVKSIIEGQITLIKKRIASAVNLTNDEILLWNLKPVLGKIDFEICVNLLTQNFDIYDGDIKVNYSINNQKYFDNENFQVVDAANIKNFNYAKKKYVQTDLNATNFLFDENDGRFETIINFQLDMPSFGYKIISLKQLLGINEIVVNKISIAETKNFKLELKDNKINSIFVEDFFDFEATIDDGDTYDYSPLKNLNRNIAVLKKVMVQNIINNNISILSLKYFYLFNSGIKYYDSKEQILNVKFIIKDNYIDVKINLQNEMRNIRWRSIVKTNILKTKYSFADQCSSIQKRLIHDSKVKEAIENDWIDVPIEIESNESLVYLANEKNAFALFTKGNNEYQIIGSNDEKIALTLFRRVSLIGKRNLLYRRGRASGIDNYPHKTPDSNLNKHLEFNFGIASLNDTNKLNFMSKKFNLRSVYYQKQNINPFHFQGDTFVLSQRFIKTQLKNNSFLEINNADLLVQTALKESWDKNYFIIRYYNPTNKIIEIKSKNIVHECNLTEEISDKKNLSIKPNEVKTFAIKL
ncbi:glycosyl hydrolase-related protein [Spiroplasma endosymbiont of Labia minor]|uniref:glycoside hydrolase family 38 N-terminal domain-containing protein n=1 Tax=Spiroplasma endosymbiont of Labia minor TaxID=3066305 RepID=UPI0030CB0E1D